MICYKKNEKNPQISCPFSELPMFKPKLLFQFQCLRLKAKVARKAFDVSFPVVLVTTLVNIEKKLRKTTFCKSLCLPSKVQKIFFLHIFVFSARKVHVRCFWLGPRRSVDRYGHFHVWGVYYFIHCIAVYGHLING